MMDMVSIVLPVYNGQKYLEESIKSILNQTYSDIELIIVNDASTDCSEEIILNFQKEDQRIVYIKNNQNLKLPQSLNKGFAYAKGEYLSWTSDDNLYHEDAIETMVNYLENAADVEMVYCDYNSIDEKGEKICTITVGNDNELKYRNVVGACFMYRRRIIEEIGNYDSKMFLVEDYEYWLRINLSFTISPLHKCLYDYRIHEDSLTSQKKKEIQTALKKLHFSYLRKYEKCDIKEDLFYYFEYILRFEENCIKRNYRRLVFSFKHVGYFKIFGYYILRKIGIKK